MVYYKTNALLYKPVKECLFLMEINNKGFNAMRYLKLFFVMTLIMILTACSRDKDTGETNESALPPTVLARRSFYNIAEDAPGMLINWGLQRWIITERHLRDLGIFNTTGTSYLALDRIGGLGILGQQAAFINGRIDGDNADYMNDDITDIERNR